ncbi:hypothetical protein WMY93_006589 [Mugilogobius chulae]|uniref:Uncharacterized protein n=1 Tax=Mugilogobius chulae TaxID=88201 RepID=A0AAW0PNS1_9GOBI
MSGFVGGLLKARRAFTSRAVFTQQRATYIHGKPPQSKVGALETVFVLAVMSLTILGPSGWILAHLEHYKSRDSAADD